MRKFIFIVGFSTCVLGPRYWSSCSSNERGIENVRTQVHYESYTSFPVTVTFYRPDEGQWGWRKSTGGYLTAGRSAAVDPSIIPYGTHLSLPGFNDLVAEDTGSAVKSKTASHLRAVNLLESHKINVQQFNEIYNYPVVDIFVPTKKEYDQLCKTTPYFMTATLR